MDGATYTKLNEGCRLEAYQDTLGVWTIGYGCTGPEIVAGLVWNQEQADSQFQYRYAQAVAGAIQHFGNPPWFHALNEVRQAACIDMVYQLGPRGFGEFEQMLSALHCQEWQEAHDTCLQSLYAEQTPARARRNASIFLTGQWPDMGV